MKTLSTSTSLLVRLTQTLRRLQASMSTWAPRPMLVPMPIPIRLDRRHQDTLQRRRHSGF